MVQFSGHPTVYLLASSFAIVRAISLVTAILVSLGSGIAALAARKVIPARSIARSARSRRSR